MLAIYCWMKSKDRVSAAIKGHHYFSGFAKHSSRYEKLKVGIWKTPNEANACECRALAIQKKLTQSAYCQRVLI